MFLSVGWTGYCGRASAQSPPTIFCFCQCGYIGTVKEDATGIYVYVEGLSTCWEGTRTSPSFTRSVANCFLGVTCCNMGFAGRCHRPRYRKPQTKGSPSITREERLQPSASSLSVIPDMVPIGGCPGKVQGPRPPASEVGFPNQHATAAMLKVSGCRGREVVHVQYHIVASLLIKASALPLYCLDWSILQPAGKIPRPKLRFLYATDAQLSQSLLSSPETRNSSFNPSKMFYKPGTPHNLPKDPFKACVIPRPIGWISSISGGEPQPLASLPPSFLSFLPFLSPFL